MSKFLFVILALIAIVASQGAPSGGRKPGDVVQRSGPNPRDIQVSNSNKDEILFLSKKRGDSGVNSWMRFLLRVRGGLVVRMDGLFKSRVDNKVETVKLNNRIKFEKIVYYTETGAANSGFQNTDTVVSEIQLTNSVWPDIDNACTKGTTGYVCSIQSVDGQIGFNFYLNKDTSVINGLTVNSTSVKFDFLFNKTNTAFVAVVARLESRTVSKERTDSTLTASKQRSFGTDSNAAFFDFVDTATIGSTNVDVITSQFVDSTSEEPGDRPHAKLITFSFPSNAVGDLVWDPSLGAAEDTTSSASVLSFAFLLMIALLFLNL